MSEADEQLSEEQLHLAPTMDVCRRITLMLPLAHVLNDVPMRNPAERLLRVVTLLESAIQMTDGGAFEFRKLIQQSNVAAALHKQLVYRKSGSVVFPAALNEEVGRARQRPMGGINV